MSSMMMTSLHCLWFSIVHFQQQGQSCGLQNIWYFSLCFSQISLMLKVSGIWCSECGEGLCLDCREHHGASKSTRHHVTVPIKEYGKLPIFILNIKEICEKHNEKYQMFCKPHDCPCCWSTRYRTLLRCGGLSTHHNQELVSTLSGNKKDNYMT
jgi:hypothetical protein